MPSAHFDYVLGRATIECVTQSLAPSPPDLQGRTQLNTQRYRSGHNGADSKSVCEQSHEGSNPSLCAIQRTPIKSDFSRFYRVFYYLLVRRFKAFRTLFIHIFGCQKVVKKERYINIAFFFSFM